MYCKFTTYATRTKRDENGQSLLEAALLVPLLLTIVFNAINMSYLWYMVLTLSAAPRLGVQYASQGGSAITVASTPSTTAIKTVVYNNLQHTIGATDSNASVRVCAASAGVDSTTHIANCVSYGPSASFPAIVADPEKPLFVLHRVDVSYTVTPLIPGGVFNVLLPSNLTFKRQVTMRSLY